jgi:hypothetical protein
MNYDKEMMKIIESLDYTPRLLLHSCCAPCSSSVITRLMKYFHITILYYNPNIEPYEEYLKRKNEQIELLKKIESPNTLYIMDADYDNDTYHELVKNNEKDPERGARCYICYKQRIDYTAKIAKENEYDYFTTTLSVSPYKVSSWINEIGLEASKKYGVKFLVADFKKQNGYKQSIILSEKYGLYRQNYCGCIYSKKEN